MSLITSWHVLEHVNFFKDNLQIQLVNIGPTHCLKWVTVVITDCRVQIAGQNSVNMF